MSVDDLKFFLRNPALYKWRKKGFNAEFYKTLIGEYYQQMGIKTILDIGANTGQSVITFHNAFPKATIHAFEPLPDCFKELSRNVAGLSGIMLHNIAIGDQVGNITFEENEYSASSSVLSMTDQHISNFPFTKNRKQTAVRVEMLDTLLETVPLYENMLIKIDVQGYEKHVILGGRKVISQAKVLIVETSFETLYNGQPLFDEIYKIIQSMGFQYIGAFDQLISPQSNKILQQDAIFIRA
ncbi:FkbM family methyltransferase [Spirosoma areae]